ncbi:MAG: AAA family ATPase, partial [Ruminiclostridium sp.]|nr:AAA family ATPase [Ruminiclostridium sp.]
MAKSKTVYICEECGQEYPKWSGRCNACGAWNTLTETLIQPNAHSAGRSISGGGKLPLTSINALTFKDETRYNTGMSELDRVLGGGLVKGSLVLLGGDPGIGKSTLLLQICGSLAKDKTV